MNESSIWFHDNRYLLGFPVDGGLSWSLSIGLSQEMFARFAAGKKFSNVRIGHGFICCRPHKAESRLLCCLSGLRPMSPLALPHFWPPSLFSCLQAMSCTHACLCPSANLLNCAAHHTASHLKFIVDVRRISQFLGFSFHHLI